MNDPITLRLATESGGWNRDTTAAIDKFVKVLRSLGVAEHQIQIITESLINAFRAEYGQ